ncbi:hypothetical protein KDU71_07765 [Carboxylicivirga sediminis]|uniref:Uncharacterized protein n=1 Tax=Carboxylicivirga sediminis TaxID=2006564 RepID=A0A941IY53_9BACT|nr:hypothetical protein [Carboxylicivirga sediminis]MBR8535452.1 hypothetical protein [Carboxylicivirga sediminis]
MSYFFNKLKAKNQKIKELERIILMKERLNKELQNRCSVLEDELIFASQDMQKNMEVLKTFASS